MENKHFKAKTIRMIIGICVLLFAVLLELGLIFGIKEEDSRTLLLVAGNVIMVLPVGFFGFAYLSSYFDDCKNIKKALDKYGEDKIKAHIAGALEREYTKQGNTYYFTDKVIVDFKQGVIPYNMIAYAHTTNVKTKYNSLTSITLKTYDGEVFGICDKISGKDAEEYLNYLAQKNPSIMLGYSEAQDQKYNDLTDKYKKGENNIADTVL